MAITSVLLSLAVAAAADPPPQGEAGCMIVRIYPDGTRTVTRAATDTRSGGPGAHAWAAGRSSSSSSSSSSISVRSSSRGDAGRFVASATVRDGTGQRTVTTTQDHNGCTTVIDERAPERNNR